MKLIGKYIIYSLILMVGFSSCKKDTDDDDGALVQNQTSVVVKLTDDPFPFNFVSHANVGVAKIELKKSNGEYVTVFEGSSSYDMVGLRNGTTTNVCSANIEAGNYAEARVTLNSCSVQLNNGNDYNLDSDASGAYTVAISPVLDVEAGATSTVLLDLDVSSSYNFQGPWMGQWCPSISSIIGCNFSADFSACDLDQTGTITGTVSAESSNVSGAYVYVVVDGNQISTITEADGSFSFIGVSAGTYTVHCQSNANGNGSVDGVNVSVSGTASCSIVL